MKGPHIGSRFTVRPGAYFMSKTKLIGLIVVSVFSGNALWCQTPLPETHRSSNNEKAEIQEDVPTQSLPSGDVAASANAGGAGSNTTQSSQQPKRILGIIPNYRAVSADTQMPPLSMKAKFGLATQDSFDYSSLILAGIIAGIGQLQGSGPEFGRGAPAYGRYYWHALADEINGN